MPIDIWYILDAPLIFDANKNGRLFPEKSMRTETMGSGGAIYSGSRSIYIRYTMARLDEVRKNLDGSRIAMDCWFSLKAIDIYVRWLPWGWWEWIPWMMRMDTLDDEISESAFFRVIWWISLFKGKSPVEQLLFWGGFSLNSLRFWRIIIQSSRQVSESDYSDETAVSLLVKYISYLKFLNHTHKNPTR